MNPDIDNHFHASGEASMGVQSPRIIFDQTKNIPIARTNLVIFTASEPALRVAREKDNADAVQQIAVIMPAISPG